MQPPYDDIARLASLARAVRGGRSAALPPLLALTDPARTPDPLALASHLPPGSGLVYRHFGAAERFETGHRMAKIARSRGLVFLVSADRELETALAPDGVHWPESRLAEAASRRRRGDARLFSGALHGGSGLARARAADLDAVLLSPVFPSASPSATTPLGPLTAAAIARRAGLPVYALGGVNTRTARRLLSLGFSGLAAVGALAAELGDA
ncbi:thiamine phosphate synthase [Maricaulis sp. CAU 1757]